MAGPSFEARETKVEELNPKPMVQEMSQGKKQASSK